MPAIGRADRRYSGDRPEDNRRKFERDRDRILYTTAFRRLAGVTQVASAWESQAHVFHSRLTHSLEVAQIGRRLAEKLVREQGQDYADTVGGVSPDVVEAACLAHDLGHPPFGHIAEKELDRLVAEEQGVADGFEGNAQSFRIVTRLARRHEKFPGLNLTRATLNAILKYPNTRQPKDKKWGAFETERADFDYARQLLPNDVRRSAEAELMDWADDVAYAIHDADDFFRAGLVPLDRLKRQLGERERFLEGAFDRWREDRSVTTKVKDEAAEALEFIVRLFPIAEPFQGTRTDRAALRSFSAALIARFIDAIRLRIPVNNQEPWVEIRPEAKMEVEVLKQLIWEYIILRPSLSTQQAGQRGVVKTLFDTFHSAAKSDKASDRAILPLGQREELRQMTGSAVDEATLKGAWARIAADIVAGLTEDQALRLHQRLVGGAGSILDQLP